MSRSKKTRTKSTEPRLRQIRLKVAAEAARIIATEGQHNYHAAKKKAAERIGINERLALPSNLEIKEAVLRHLDLYGGCAHTENLVYLRQAAVRAMQLLEKFNPKLVGNVLDGTAGEYSHVALHIFSDSTESVILQFLEHGTPFSQEQRQIRWYDGNHRTVPILIFELEDIAIEHAVVELTIFEPVHLRQAPPSPISGKPQRRAGLSEVQCLLAESLTPLKGLESAIPVG